MGSIFGPCCGRSIAGGFSGLEHAPSPASPKPQAPSPKPNLRWACSNVLVFADGQFALLSRVSRGLGVQWSPVVRKRRHQPGESWRCRGSKSAPFQEYVGDVSGETWQGVGGRVTSRLLDQYLDRQVVLEIARRREVISQTESMSLGPTEMRWLVDELCGPSPERRPGGHRPRGIEENGRDSPCPGARQAGSGRQPRGGACGASEAHRR